MRFVKDLELLRSHSGGSGGLSMASSPVISAVPARIVSDDIGFGCSEAEFDDAVQMLKRFRMRTDWRISAEQ